MGEDTQWREIHGNLRVMGAPHKRAQMEWRTMRNGVDTSKHVVLSGIDMDEPPPFVAQELRDDLDHLLRSNAHALPHLARPRARCR